MDINDKRNQSGGFIPRGTHEETQILGTRGEVQPTFHRVLPHTAMYVTPADQLLLNVTPETFGGSMLLNYRLMLPDGTIQTAQETLQIVGNGNEQTKFIPLVEGWLLSVTVYFNSAQVPTGTTYVQVFLVRSGTAQVVWPTLLIGEYINSFYHLAWPGSPVIQPVNGRGWPNTKVAAAVGAGANITLQLDIHHRFVIDYVQVTLATAAAVANRLVQLNLFDGVRTFAVIPSNATQTASTTFQYFFAKGMQYIIYNTTEVFAPFPLDMESPSDAPLLITAAAFGLQAADQFSNMFVRTRQWQESD